MRRDLGDFQTPPELVAAVLDTLGPIGARWPRVLEPTCGQGHFLGGLLEHASPPCEIQAIEIQPVHCRSAGERVARHGERGDGVTITCADLFQLDLGRDLRWRRGGPLLVVGNPPWVTNSELGSLANAQTPPKSNVKGLRGLEARTGASNFDVAEAVWLKLARDLAAEGPTIALLCKTAVARRILQFAHQTGLPIAEATIHKIDAARWFGASVDACWFRVTVAKPDEIGGMASPSGGCAGNAGVTAATPGPWPQSPGGWGRARRAKPPGNPQRCEHIPVYPALESDEPATVMSFSRGWLIADRAAHRRCAFADGTCPETWRQGLKHDAAAVMELAVTADTGQLQDRSGRTVNVEREFVYPLLKGTDLKRPPAERPSRAVLVTQQRIGDDTTRLAERAPGSGPTCGRMPAGSSDASRRSTAASPRLPSSASGPIASPRTRWRSPVCTRLRSSGRLGPSTAGRSCSTTPATSCPVPPPRRPPRWRPSATIPSRWS